MSLLDFGRLTKLKITAIETKEVFTAMFNPESYSEKFSISYKEMGTASSGVEEYNFLKSMPQDFKLKIIIDGTGVSEFSVPFLPSAFGSANAVLTQINTFLKMAWLPSEQANNKPNSLEIEWGEFKFCGKLKDVTINYSLFDRDGKPLRADLDATFISDTEKNINYYKERFKKAGLSSVSALAGGATSGGGLSVGASSGVGVTSGNEDSQGSSQGIVISLT